MEVLQKIRLIGRAHLAANRADPFAVRRATKSLTIALKN
jgi:hypothetical protein